MEMHNTEYRLSAWYLKGNSPLVIVNEDSLYSREIKNNIFSNMLF